MLRYTLKSHKFYSVALFLIAFVLVENAEATENRHDNHYNTPGSTRIASPSRYSLRARPIPTNFSAIQARPSRISAEIGVAKIVPPQVVSPKTMLSKRSGQSAALRPRVMPQKTELLIKPFEHYNDRPIKLVTPYPRVIDAPQNVVLPWMAGELTPSPEPTPVIAKTVDVVNTNLVSANIEMKPAEKPSEVKLATTKMEEVDFSVQPLQIEQPLKIEQPIAEPKIDNPPFEEVPFEKNPSEKVTIKRAITEAPPIAVEQKIVSEPPPIQLTEPQPAEISAQSKNILQKLPNDIFPTPRTANGNFDVSRTKAEPNGAEGIGASQEIGASVAVRRQAFDVNYELDKAYNSLIRGNTEAAVHIYRQVLSEEPNNKYALFGLATTYHKLGMAEQARPLYGRLLELDPYNKEALNNFLALVGEEAPESAILYLEQLKNQNNDFSPIYAQLAGLYLKAGNNPLAIENMQEAVAISPENLVYKYNLAVMYDKSMQKERAATIYRQLVKAGLDGAELPASLRDIQKRLTFLSSN